MKIYEGEVAKFVERGDGSGYGFIKSQPEGAQRPDRMFYTCDEITPDNIGRRSLGKLVGTPVRFRLEKYLYHGDPSVRAIEVTPLFLDDVADPENHREVSVVERLIPSKSRPGTIGYALLRRASGECLFLSLASVADSHKNKFHQLKVGDHVWHSVDVPLKSDQAIWRATHAEFYSADEEAAMNAMNGGEIRAENEAHSR